MTESVPVKTILVRAQHILDACEHVRETGVPFVGLLFVGEDCIGVNTDPRLPVSGQERPAELVPPVRIESRQPTSRWGEAVSEERILALLREYGPLNAQGVGDRLGLDRNDTVLRGRLSRVLKSFAANGTIAKEDPSQRYPRYVISSDSRKHVSGRVPRVRARKRYRHVIPSAEITPEKVINIITERKRATSMEISDTIGIPRDDGPMRGKVSTIIRELRTAHKIKIVNERTKQGFRIYELSS